MASDQGSRLSHNPSEQLVRIKGWCQQSAPAFYAEQEKYLSVLRDCLPKATHRALKELLCQVDDDRLALLSEQDRRSLQDRIDQLVQRCSTLLTIEQLQLLARRLVREKHERRRQAQQAMVDALHRSTDNPPEGPAEDSGADETSQSEGADESVELRFAPPIEQPSLLDGLLPPPGFEDKDELLDDASTDSFEQQLPLNPPPAMNEEDPGPSQSMSDADNGDMAMLRSLFVMAGEALDDSSGETSIAAADSDDPDAAFSSLEQAGDEFMPSMPLELLRWLDGLDAAIHRRLRNLSHAINVELLRAGVASSLLPMSILDAVLKGQVETLPSASNLVRLRLPLPMTTPGDPLMDLSCVLLRPSELEFDLVALRRCRARLRQRRHNLLTMVRQQRHWQRRAQTQQVQQQWWPSPPTSPPQS